MALEGMLSGVEPPPDQPALRPLADMLTALTAAPAEDELTGLPAALVEFRRLAGSPPAAGARGRPARRTPWLAPRLTAKAAAAAAAAVIGLGGLATAAYAGALPVPLQRLAHEVIGAPDSAGSAGPRQPSARASRRRSAREQSGQLCSAYFHPATGQSVRQHAIALRRLAAAAGGAAKIGAYCAEAGRAAPSHQPSPGPTASAHPTPWAHPTPSHPTPSHPTPSPSHPTPSHPSPGERGGGSPSGHPSPPSSKR